MNYLAVPFHFTVTFLVAVVSAAGVWATIARPSQVPAKRGPRFAFGMGWALLALAEVLHGSLVTPTELDQGAFAMRSGAYAFFVLSLIGSRVRKAKPQVGAHQLVGVGGGNFMPIFLAAAAALFTLRSSLSGAKRLAIALSLFTVSELLFGLGGAEATSNPGLLWYLAHGIRLSGGIAVAWWMWQTVRSSIQVRFVGLFIALMLVVVVGISSLMTQIFASNVREEALRRALLNGQLQQRSIEDAEEQSLGRARLLAEQQEVKRLFAERSPALAEVARTLQSPGGLMDTSAGVDFLAFIDSGGAVLALSAINPGGPPTLNDADAISLAGGAVVQSALNQVQAASIDQVGLRNMAIVGAYPVVAPRGTEDPGSPPQVAGVVALGRMLDRDFLLKLPGIEEEAADQEVTIANRNSVLATTVQIPFTLSEVRRREVQDSVFDRGETITREESIGTVAYFNAYVPLERRDGVVIASLIVSQRSEVLEATQRDVGSTLFLVALVAAAIGIILSSLTGSRITRPIRRLTAAAERVRSGYLETRVGGVSEDEVGTLGSAFDEMTQSVAQLTGELREVAAEERSLRTQIETILQSMAEGVVAIDKDGIIVAFNREAERITGRTSSSAIGESAEQVLKIVSPGGGRTKLPLFSLKKGSVRGAIAGPRRRGLTQVAVTSAPIEDESGHLVGAVGVLRDLSREIEVEKMKTEFLSNVSHELRTPLTPIKGYTDLLRRGGVPNEAAQSFLDTIHLSVRRLERIVDMLVDFAAMEAGRLIPRKTLLDLDKSTATLVRAWHEETSVHRFERRGFSRLPQAMVDERLVPRAINELIDNAVKFSPKGGKITITGEVDRTGNGAGTVRISVSDQGIGITQEELPRIFEDFVQVDSTETRQFGGMGLGLAYVRRIAEAHDGELQVLSTAGEGSRFTLVFPRAAILEGPTPNAKTRSSRPSRKSISKGKGSRR